jgi:hypothetical protein
MLGHGEPKALEPRIRLVINKIFPSRVGILVRYVGEVVMTNEGDTPLPVPIGVDEDALLNLTQHDREALFFAATFIDGGPALAQSGATSASNREHPESAVLLEHGDSVVFLLPLGMWPANKVPPGKVVVSVQRERKVLDGGTDWLEVVGPVMRSENSMPLAPAPVQTEIRQ